MYDVETDSVREVTKDTSQVNGPRPSFTLRTTLDPLTEEIFAMSGREHDFGLSSNTICNTLWSCDLRTFKWTLIEPNKDLAASTTDHPIGRFAHQFCYDHTRRTHYVLGGNPGDTESPYRRLDDFWQLTLHKPEVSSVVEQIRFLLRKQKYLELCSSDYLKGLEYLQQQVSSVCNSQNYQFRKLASHLCQPLPQEDAIQQRTELFSTLAGLYPESMKQPPASVVDFVV